MSCFSGYFTSETEEVIRQRMLDAIPDDLDKSEGSHIWDAIAPAAIELAQAYIALDRVITLGFAQTTYGQYLDMRGNEIGLPRNDNESDADYLTRILEKARLPATSGNVAHYIQWAKEVSGVGNVRVIPVWDGPGTVKTIIIDSDKQPASAEIVQDAQEYIDPNGNGDGAGEAPIGAATTVESAAGLNIDVEATVILEAEAVLEDVQAAFGGALVDYLKSIALEKSYVSYAHIGVYLFDTVGVADYSGLTVNGGTANVAVGNTQVAIKGTVTLNVQV